MSAHLSLEGLAELRTAIAALGDTVTATLAPEVDAAAEGMVQDVRSSYPRKTGNLADHVQVVATPGDPLRVRVRSTARHAHLYEYGTVSRFTNQTGAARGTMPARPVFVPAAIRWRARLIRAAAERLNRMRVPGFRGSPGGVER